MKHNVADLVLSADELTHFTQMVNVCLAGTSRGYRDDPYVAVVPFLEELEEHLNLVVPPRVTRDELKRLISGWIDQKISWAKEIPAPG